MTSRSRSPKAPPSCGSAPPFSEPGPRPPITLRERDGAVDLPIHVQPRARRNEVAGYHAGSLKLRLQAPPVEGAANRAALELVADLIGVARSRVRLVSGERARDKVVRIAGVTAGDIRRVLLKTCEGAADDVA